MFHVKPYWVRAAEFCRLELDDDQVERMERYGDWLSTEGIAAGGIGPAEGERIDRRHLADSVLFASQLGTGEEVWDLGSGVGLPGIPLAICLPHTSFVLLDRSGRRVDLVRRVIRVLDLENCQAVQGEISEIDGEIGVMVSRASLPPTQLAETGRRHLSPGGVLVAGGSWQEPPQHRGWVTVEIPRDVLDQPVWLLIMRRQ